MSLLLAFILFSFLLFNLSQQLLGVLVGLFFLTILGGNNSLDTLRAAYLELGILVLDRTNIVVAFGIRWELSHLLYQILDYFNMT